MYKPTLEQTTSDDSRERQERMFDAIRYTLLMVESAYKGLEHVLEGITSIKKPTEDDYVYSLIGTWTVIDCVDRLRLMIESTPGISKDEKSIRHFLHQTKKVRALRNIIQHANKAEELRKMIKNNIPFWGYLTWFQITNSQNGIICALAAGTRIKEEKIPLMNPLGRRMTGKVGLIVIHTSDCKLSVSEMYEEVRALKIFLSRQAFSVVRSPNDLFTSLNITFEQPSVK